MGSDLDKVDIFQTDSVVQLCEGIWEDTEIVKNKIESLCVLSDVFVISVVYSFIIQEENCNRPYPYGSVRTGRMTASL